jgi:hypothetical protein
MTDQKILGIHLPQSHGGLFLSGLYGEMPSKLGFELVIFTAISIVYSRNDAAPASVQFGRVAYACENVIVEWHGSKYALSDVIRFSKYVIIVNSNIELRKFRKRGNAYDHSNALDHIALDNRVKARSQGLAEVFDTSSQAAVSSVAVPYLSKLLIESKPAVYKSTWLLLVGLGFPEVYAGELAFDAIEMAIGYVINKPLSSVFNFFKSVLFKDSDTTLIAKTLFSQIVLGRFMRHKGHISSSVPQWEDEFILLTKKQPKGEWRIVTQER